MTATQDDDDVYVNSSDGDSDSDIAAYSGEEEQNDSGKNDEHAPEAKSDHHDANLSDECIRDYLRIERDHGRLGNDSGNSNARLSMKTKALAVLLYLEELEKGLQRGAWVRIRQHVKDLSGVEVQLVQLRRFATARSLIVQQYKEGRNERLRGGGRRSSVAQVEEQVANDARAAHERGQPLSQSAVMSQLGTDSPGVYRRFLRRYNLSTRKPEVDTKVSVEQLKTQLKCFHDQAAFLHNAVKHTVSNIVQFDEIALSLSGSLSRSVRAVVAPRGETCVSESCALFDHRKIATGIFFLSETKIPPLLIMKGSHTLAEKYAHIPNLLFAPGANTTEAIMVDKVIPHVLKHNPRATVFVFDLAT